MTDRSVPLGTPEKSQPSYDQLCALSLLGVKPPSWFNDELNAQSGRRLEPSLDHPASAG